MQIRTVLLAMASAVTLAACGSTADGTPTVEESPDDAVAATPWSPYADYPPLTPNDYSTTINCNDRQGIFPAASGTLTNLTHHAVGFEVWVTFTAPGGGVALSNAFTGDKVSPGGVGTWKTFTVRMSQLSSCQIVCVGEVIPIKRAPRMNCQEWADLHSRQS